MQDMLLGVYSSAGFALCPYVLFTMHCQIMQVSNEYHMIIIIMMTIMIFKVKLSRRHWLPGLSVESSVPSWCSLKASKKSSSHGFNGICWSQRSLSKSETDTHYFNWCKLFYLRVESLFDLEASFYQKFNLGTFRLNREDIRLDFQLNQMIWSQGHLKNHLRKKNLLMKNVAKKVIFLQAAKMSQTIPTAQILKLEQSQKNIQLIPIKSFPVNFRSIYTLFFTKIKSPISFKSRSSFIYSIG